MADFFDNGESNLVVRTLINSLADLLKIAETDVEVAAGATTSIPVTTLTYDLGAATDLLVLIDSATGEAHQLTLTDAMEATDTVITVSSHTFATAIPVGSKIYFLGVLMLNRMYHPL